MGFGSKRGHAPPEDRAPPSGPASNRPPPAGIASRLARRALRAFVELPRGLKLALVATLIVHAIGIGWGMPASDAWDNDGIAPRDFLPGLAETFTPGQYFTYPPLHLALLAVLTLPVTIVAVVRAGSLDVPSILREIIAPPYMTAMAMTARTVSLLMSVAIVAVLAKLSDAIVRDDRAPPGKMHPASIGAAWFAALGFSFTYYAHVTNLDVPYLFWCSLAALQLTRAVLENEPRRLRAVAVLAALGAASKDQAYALFLLGLPLTLAGWLWVSRGDRASVRAILLGSLRALVTGAAVLLVADGALFNPSGFKRRLAFLSGSASQDFAQYSKDASGRLLALLDTVRAFDLHYPPLLGVFVVVGFVRALRLAKGARARVATLVPLLLAVSFTLCFNLVARRVEERFTLPQALLTSVYAGFGVEALWSAGAWWSARLTTATERTKRGLTLASRLLAVVAMSPALYRALSVDSALLQDPRYATEAFLEAHVKPDDVIEVHGLNTYLPRFPARAHVVRVGSSSPKARGPLPGVTEVRAPLMDIAQRNPTWIVACGCYTWRYFERPDVDFDAKIGRVVPKTQGSDAADADATSFFRALLGQRLGYRRVQDTLDVPPKFFAMVNLHASLGCRTFVYLRDDVPLER